MKLIPDYISYAIQGRDDLGEIRRSVVHSIYGLVRDTKQLVSACRDGVVFRHACLTVRGVPYALIRVREPTEVDLGVLHTISARGKGLYLLNKSGPVFCSNRQVPLLLESQHRDRIALPLFAIPSVDMCELANTKLEYAMEFVRAGLMTNTKVHWGVMSSGEASRLLSGVNPRILKIPYCSRSEGVLSAARHITKLTSGVGYPREGLISQAVNASFQQCELHCHTLFGRILYAAVRIRGHENPILLLDSGLELRGTVGDARHALNSLGLSLEEITRLVTRCATQIPRLCLEASRAVGRLLGAMERKRDAVRSAFRRVIGDLAMPADGAVLSSLLRTPKLEYLEELLEGGTVSTTNADQLIKLVNSPLGDFFLPGGRDDSLRREPYLRVDIAFPDGRSYTGCTVNEIEPFANNLKLPPQLLHRRGLMRGQVGWTEASDYYVAEIVRAWLELGMDAVAVDGSGTR